MSEQRDVLIRKEQRAGRMTLNRPAALNALTWEMALAIEKALDAWASDGDVHVVVIDSAGEKAFCAGGDIAELYQKGRAGDYDYGRRFWSDEYRLNAKIHSYKKPFVAIMDGIAMGGGVGVSAHGTHRIVTERSVVAMPETGIGLIPDVGGTFLLSRAPGHCGEYLNMTSARMSPGDAIFAGFADLYLPSSQKAAAIAALCETGDPLAAGALCKEPPSSDLKTHLAEINELFAGADALATVKALESAGTPFSMGAAAANEELACNPRLRNAIHYLADAARRCDEKSKAKYLALKARGCSHARALRTIGDRLLYVACAMLKNRTLFDPCLESQKCA